MQKILENSIQSGQNQIDAKNYLKDSYKAIKFNERFELIKIIYKSNYNIEINKK